jgi:hypothetical protein
VAKATTDRADGSLRRLGGGRWQTRDDRFTIEPQSGTWVIVDAEQTDDLGLPLVRGPFPSLTAAKEVIAAARGAEPAVSPLAEQLARLRDRRAAEPADKPTRTARPKPVEPEPPPEPAWIRDLEPGERRRALDLVGRLTKAGADDADGIAQREVAGKVPAVAALAISRAVTALGPEATPGQVTKLLTAGADPELGVVWRIVDGDDRPIVLDLAARKVP